MSARPGRLLGPTLVLVGVLGAFRIVLERNAAPSAAWASDRQAEFRRTPDGESLIRSDYPSIAPIQLVSGPPDGTLHEVYVDRGLIGLAQVRLGFARSRWSVATYQVVGKGVELPSGGWYLCVRVPDGSAR